MRRVPAKEVEEAIGVRSEMPRGGASALAAIPIRTTAHMR